MKRVLALFIVAALLSGGAALSEVLPWAGSSGNASTAMPSIVAEVDGTLYYTLPSGDAADETSGPNELWSSTGGTPALRAETYSSAVYIGADDAIYFLGRDNSKYLMALDLKAGSVVKLGNLGFENARLTATPNGLMLSGLVDVGVYANRIFDRAALKLKPSDIDPTGEYRAFEAFETLETADDMLLIRASGEQDWKNVYAGDPAGQAELDGVLYYVVPQRYMEDAYAEIYRYDPVTGANQYVSQADGDFTGQMVSGNGRLALTSPSGVIAIDAESGAAEALYLPLSPLIDPALVQLGETLYLYARPEDGSQRQYVTTLSLSGAAPQPTPAPEPTAAPMRDLAKGSRGEDVLRLQMRLNELGYDAGKEDGIYGASTDGAVCYFQNALGVSETGKASAALQEELYAAGAPEYVEFVALSRGDKGIRVEALQTRLRALGYTAANADGIYGSRTVEAVKLFQGEIGLKQTGEAAVTVLKRLMASNAPQCSVYITLKKGDSGDAVEMLQGRLKTLGYYAGSASGSFDSRTAAAVKLFQGEIGQSEDGTANQKLQKRLFASGAPKCSQYIELKYGDSGLRVKELQTQLKKTGYFDGSLGGHFGTQTQSAVKAFQRDMGLKQTGVATVSLQQTLYDEGPVTPRPTRTLKPTPTPTHKPKPTPKPSPTPSGQVISNAALDDLVDLLNARSNTPKTKYNRRTAVKWLQGNLLQMQYFDTWGGDLSEIYDQPTFDAVKKFQKDIGISLSSQNYGYVRQKTLDAIIENASTWINPGDPIER